ncbi:MAG: hypothetical protein Q4E50_07095 [Tissierellia bacterium]|nr:hypothetical protein [Tissierellia bacterium]
MRKNKVKIFLLTVILLLALSACYNKEKENDKNLKTESNQENQVENTD